MVGYHLCVFLESKLWVLCSSHLIRLERDGPKHCGNIQHWYHLHHMGIGGMYLQLRVLPALCRVLSSITPLTSYWLPLLCLSLPPPLLPPFSFSLLSLTFCVLLFFFLSPFFLPSLSHYFPLFPPFSLPPSLPSSSFSIPSPLFFSLPQTGQVLGKVTGSVRTQLIAHDKEVYIRYPSLVSPLPPFSLFPPTAPLFCFSPPSTPPPSPFPPLTQYGYSETAE